MTEITYSLRALGWGPAFETQLDLEEMETLAPMRAALALFLAGAVALVVLVYLVSASGLALAAARARRRA